ncbi:TauD/TfdA dioxygenase family protein [Amycolatopsis sp. NPDC059021]|uniref:TauD/TfdA dioxygenase family protein n=1 Tax=Amycolatopsis sp. NPDC059021 TaxID=3346704 RepID=UPI00366FE22F
MTETIAAPAGVVIDPLSGNIGAEIRGVDASTVLAEETVATIRGALLEHKVVFLRDQPLDYERQVAFARRFGELTLGHPIYGGPEGRPLMREMDSRGEGTRANHWHTDLTYLVKPPSFAFLHNKVSPPVGGDTLWANTAVAYANLPRGLRELADGLRVVHSNDCDYTDDTYTGTAEYRANYLTDIFEAEHPVVRVHPETGERSLLLGGFARRVLDHGPQQGRDLLRALQDYATKPEHTVRWRWRAGDLAIWDNQSTMHYAIFDYGDRHRRGERVTSVGTVPVGVDGRPSVTLRGETAAFGNA